MITKAWLLHAKLSGDTSQIYSFLTAEQGIITAKYKGVRRLKKRALFEPFSLLWLVINTKKNWHFVASAENLGQPLNLKGISLFAGLYINELSYYLLPALGSSEPMYYCYQQTLEALASTDLRLAIEMLLRRFEWTLLKESGYRLSAFEAVTMHPICDKTSYQFIVEEGFVPCLANISGKLPGYHVKSIVEGNFSDSLVLKSAKIVMRKSIDYLLNGRKLGSRCLFSSSNPNTT